MAPAKRPGGEDAYIVPDRSCLQPAVRHRCHSWRRLRKRLNASRNSPSSPKLSRRISSSPAHRASKHARSVLNGAIIVAVLPTTANNGTPFISSKCFIYTPRARGSSRAPPCVSTSWQNPQVRKKKIGESEEPSDRSCQLAMKREGKMLGTGGIDGQAVGNACAPGKLLVGEKNGGEAFD